MVVEAGGGRWRMPLPICGSFGFRYLLSFPFFRDVVDGGFYTCSPSTRLLIDIPDAHLLDDISAAEENVTFVPD